MGKKLRLYFYFFSHIEKAKYMPSHVYGLLDKEKISGNLNIVIQVATRKISSLGPAWYWVTLERKGREFFGRRVKLSSTLGSN